MTPIYIKVEQVRKQKGVTKIHISRACGRSAAWYHDLSTGRRKMSVEALEQIAQALDVSPSYFFDHKVSDSRTNHTA